MTLNFPMGMTGLLELDALNIASCRFGAKYDHEKRRLGQGHLKWWFSKGMLPQIPETFRFRNYDELW